MSGCTGGTQQMAYREPQTVGGSNPLHVKGSVRKSHGTKDSSYKLLSGLVFGFRNTDPFIVLYMCLCMSESMGCAWMYLFKATGNRKYVIKYIACF